MTIYLYVKTHQKTGLKYLGKTERNPHTYKGSGVYWKNHIQKHGNNVETIILTECESPQELKQWGLYYSQLWNVVESEEWANLKEESGDGFSSNDAKSLAHKRIEEGTFHFLNKTEARQRSLKRVENGTHPFLGSDLQRKRLENGTHHFLGNTNPSKKRVEDGTHHLLSGSIQRETNRRLLESGQHSTQWKWICECGKEGRGKSNLGQHRRSSKCPLNSTD